nr:glycoside hydrolase family 15 protein [Pseudomonadota bacterium]
MPYQPIENYGIIGNMHTVALVGMNGSIDWLCFPHFKSPSVFAAILDDEKGGYLKIAPTAEEVTYKQFYWPETNVLITRFLSADGVGEITDYMTAPEPGGGKEHQHQLFRRVNVVRGTMEFKVECRPAFNYGRDEHLLDITLEGAAFYSPKLSLGLSSSALLKQDGNGAVREFELNEGQSAIFILQEIEAGAGCTACMTEREAVQVFVKTVDYWRRWIAKCTYTGRWREVVHRSALALK